MNEEQETITSEAQEVKTETAPQTEAPVAGDEPMDEKTEINRLLDEGYSVKQEAD